MTIQHPSIVTVRFNFFLANGFRTLLLGSIFGIAGYATPALAQTDAYGNLTPSASNTGSNYAYDGSTFPSSDNPYVTSDSSGSQSFVPKGALASLASSYDVGYYLIAETIQASDVGGVLTVPSATSTSVARISVLAGNYVTPSSTTLHIDVSGANTYAVLYQNVVSEVHITNTNGSVAYVENNTADGVVIENNAATMSVIKNSANNAHILNENGSVMNFVGNNANGATLINDDSQLDLLDTTADNATLFNQNNSKMTIDTSETTNTSLTNESGSSVTMLNNTVSGLDMHNISATMEAENNTLSGGTITNADGGYMYMKNNSMDGGSFINGSTTDSSSTMILIQNIAKNTDIENYGFTEMYGDNLSGSTLIAGANSHMVIGDCSVSRGCTADGVTTAENITFTNDGVADVSGHVSLSGSHVINNETLNLSDAILTGNGTVDNAGTLIISGTDSIDSIIANSGTINITSAAVNLSGAQLTNNATLNLSDATLTGNGTIDNAGTLNVSGTDSIDSVIANSGTIDVTSAAVNLSGAQLTNNATLNLSDATLTGNGTVDNAGTLNVSGTDSIDSVIANSGTIDVTSAAVNLSGAQLTNNATLNLSDATLTGSGNIDNAGTLNVSGTNSIDANIENAGTLNVTHGTSTLSGSITGNGSISVKNSAVILSGSSDYTGSITVQDGLLDVLGTISNSTVNLQTGATVQGGGEVGTTVLESGSVISPGTSSTIGTLTVNGNLTVEEGAEYIANAKADQALSTLTIQGVTLNNMASDLVSVTGAAKLEGGDVSFAALSGEVESGQVYRLLTAAGGVSGQFSSLTSPYVFLTPELLYSADSVDVVLRRNTLSYSSVAETRNQYETAVALATSASNSTVALALDSLTTDQARSALNSLSGEVHASARTALIQDSFYVRQAALDRLDTADCDGSIVDSTCIRHPLKPDAGIRGVLLISL
ncbi:beta strand repeat-containing protein [Acetobacter papayae]|uniref:beta strand repeat-containing protein n=1 Tax=Acetobacter papayae TaxID=1076592 RepID=UPI000A843C8D|nr:hypothetical protein [Acetobacter papayae]